MTTRILVAEDDRKQAQLLRRYLEREGYAVAVVHDGRRAIDDARRLRPDLLVLDVMMPAVDGLDVCRVLRAESDVPIVLLTARSTEDDLLLGLDLGADDYVTKPYRPRELVARVRAALRRARRHESGDAPGDPTLTVGDLTVDPTRHLVVRAGQTIACTATEFRLLAMLAASPGRVFSRRELLDGAFGFDRFVLERTVDAHIRNLRRKIEDDPAEPALLRTVYGVGYTLAVE
jgi:DNA-binding response OmpR family regulator